MFKTIITLKDRKKTKREENERLKGHLWQNIISLIEFRE